MSKTEKPFDAVALMRRLRDEIDRDVEHLTEEQRDEYIRHRAESFEAWLAEKDAHAGVAVGPLND